MKKLLFLVCCIISIVTVKAQTPEREFRAAWIATIGNIDWPSQKGLSAEQQQAEFIQLITQLKVNGLNAVIVQIRPVADAFFPSPFEDWTRYLSGKQGVPPSPYYDPLQFMIEECHKRCLEFHAWFNPYRALVDAAQNPNSAKHPTRTHPEWFVRYGGKLYFNPGLPTVQAYFTQVVLDVVKRYDIDAVHFDDYFYPYRIAGQEFPDAAAYTQYGKGMSKDDWRRNNVNVLIENLSAEIKKEKAWVKFGISPFGVWRNASKDPEGSRTNGGQTNYDDLYADVLLWLKKGWIDYVLPQLYWERGHRAADYNTLIDWWAKHSYGRHVYVGHGLYQVGVSQKACWRSFNEMDEQVALVRSTENVQGSAFYSANAFKKNLCNINGEMKDLYPRPALLPRMRWLENQELPPTAELNLDAGGLKWDYSNPKKIEYQFAIYQRPKGQKFVNWQLLDMVRGRYYPLPVEQRKGYEYVVVCLDRLHTPGGLSNNVADKQ